MKLLLAPHPDDETLFATYTLLEHHPLVVFCYPGAPRHGTPEQRMTEAAAAMRILGCDFLPPPDGDLEATLALYDPEHVWAPYPEPGGHSAHNRIGDLAVELWPGKVTWYTTYTTDGRSRNGDAVEPLDGWETLKLRALSCYQSQITNRGTAPHFHRGLEEYVVRPPVPVQREAVALPVERIPDEADDRVACPDCEKTFATAAGLKIHRTKVHPREEAA